MQYENKFIDNTNPKVYISDIPEKRLMVYWVENGKRYTMVYSRWVWERHFGKIPNGGIIHHKDMDIRNDSIENLQLTTRSEHQKLHDYKNHKRQTEKEYFITDIEYFISVEEASKILKVSPISVYRWLKQTDIPAYCFGKTWRFNADEVIEWAKQRK